MWTSSRKFQLPHGIWQFPHRFWLNTRKMVQICLKMHQITLILAKIDSFSPKNARFHTFCRWYCLLAPDLCSYLHEMPDDAPIIACMCRFMVPRSRAKAHTASCCRIIARKCIWLAKLLASWLLWAGSSKKKESDTKKEKVSIFIGIHFV